MADPVCTSALPVPVYQGEYTQAYLADKNQKTQDLVKIREDRQKNPGWNTLKEVVWAPLMSFFQLGQAIGSFLGHLVVALPAALLGGVFGLCVYAPFMKAVDVISGRENTKSFFEYVITPANLLSNIAYNRVTDFLSRWILGPAILITVVEPLLYIGGALGLAVVASPFIYRDMVHNGSKNVESLDRFLDADLKLCTFHYGWQKFDDLAAGKLRTSQAQVVGATKHLPSLPSVPPAA